MKDRQFMILLGLVVTAGLVVGLLAFRVTGGVGGNGGAAGTANAAATKLIGGDPNAPHPSAADQAVALQPDAPALAVDGGSANGEPGASTTDSPELQGPGTGDAPAPAVAAQPAASSSEPLAAAPGDTPPQ